MRSKTSNIFLILIVLSLSLFGYHLFEINEKARNGNIYYRKTSQIISSKLENGTTTLSPNKYLELRALTDSDQAPRSDTAINLLGMLMSLITLISSTVNLVETKKKQSSLL